MSLSRRKERPVGAAVVAVTLAVIVLQVRDGGRQPPKASLADAPPEVTETVTDHAVGSATAPRHERGVTRRARASPNPAATASQDVPSPATIAPGRIASATLPSVPQRPAIPTLPVLPSAPALSTQHYRFFDIGQTHARQLDLFRREADMLFRTVAARADARLEQPIAVILQDPAGGNCPARGLASSARATIVLYVEKTTPNAQARIVLAHETAHVLHTQAVTTDAIDPILAEGFATWAALPYWSVWQGLPSFEDAVRRYRRNGTIVPLEAPLADCTVATRDIVYNERASFAGYLIGRYGLPAFYRVSASRQSGDVSDGVIRANYVLGFGKDLRALEADWLAWLR